MAVRGIGLSCLCLTPAFEQALPGACIYAPSLYAGTLQPLATPSVLDPSILPHPTTKSSPSEPVPTVKMNDLELIDPELRASELFPQVEEYVRQAEAAEDPAAKRAAKKRAGDLLTSISDAKKRRDAAKAKEAAAKASKADKADKADKAVTDAPAPATPAHPAAQQQQAPATPQQQQQQPAQHTQQQQQQVPATMTTGHSPFSADPAASRVLEKMAGLLQGYKSDFLTSMAAIQPPAHQAAAAAPPAAAPMAAAPVHANTGQPPAKRAYVEDLDVIEDYRGAMFF